MKNYSSKELLQILRKDGWDIVEYSGSHVQMKHPAKPGKVTLPHPRRNLKKKTISSIAKQAGITLKN